MSEIDLNGQVVQLTNFDLPTEKVAVKVNMGQSYEPPCGKTNNVVSEQV